MSDFIRRLLSREFLAWGATFLTASALCWFGKLDGTSWVAAASLSTSVLMAGRSVVKALGKGEQ